MGFKIIFKSGIYLAALVGIFTMIPSRKNVTFTKFSVAPEKPFSYALNKKLSGGSKLFENKIIGPEGLLYHNNSFYTTVHYGHVLKLVNDETTIPVAKFGKVCDGLHEEHICGRPLGIAVDKKGFLYVADAYYGIFKVDINSPQQYGAKEQIVSMDKVIDGAKPKLPNSIAIASDGVMYWSDSDTNYDLKNGVYTMLVDGTGRLLKYDPKTKQNTVLIKNLNFANGVSLSEDESFVLVSETMKYRVHKYYLKGPNAGKSEIFIEGLTGMPDNIKRIGKYFYFPLIFPRLPVIDNIGEYPTARMIAFKLLEIVDYTFETIDYFYPNLYCKLVIHKVGHFQSLNFFQSVFTPRLTILKINEKGTIISSFHSTDGKFAGICDIEVVGEKVYLGSPFNSYLGVTKLPPGFI